jgi:hypothetical protein
MYKNNYYEIIMLLCYYAYPITTHDFLIESNNIQLLENLGFEIMNPSTSKEIREELQNRIHLDGKFYNAEFFEHALSKCSILAFRTLPDEMTKTNGAVEINEVFRYNLPIIELPQDIESCSLSNEEIITYLYQANFIKYKK